MFSPRRPISHNGLRRCFSAAATPRSIRRRPYQIPLILLSSTAGLVIVAQWRFSHTVHADQPPEDQPSQIVFEQPRRAVGSSEENRDLISSQHLQVKRSWENPGLYAWGFNGGKVAAPESDETFIKTARRFAFFDDIILRDVKLDKRFGAAIDENGDLFQWGTAFESNCRVPVKTLTGRRLRSITISSDRILALSDDGTVYSIPVPRDEQLSGPKVSQSTWIPFWSRPSTVSYRKLEAPGLAYGEKVVQVAGGLTHVLLLTSKGRVFSAAAGSEDYPRHGQLGIPGLTWQTRPPGAYDKCHEITTLRGFDIKKVAAGDYHSLVVDRDGRVFSFGDNSFGQLGLEFNPESSCVDAPSLLPTQKLYAGSSQVPKVTNVEAGGTNSYFTVDATSVASQNEDTRVGLSRRLGSVTTDTWSCGQGLAGQLGNGRWTHIQSSPVKIPSLSGLFEYDEQRKLTVPIRLRRLSVGQNHVAALMDNVTHLGVSRSSSENETNWGADIVFFGNNEFYQLGTGKRNNSANPVYIQPLDQAAEQKFRKGEQHRFQMTPAKRIKVNGSWANVEQRIECGRGVTAVYSGA